MLLFIFVAEYETDLILKYKYWNLTILTIQSTYLSYLFSNAEDDNFTEIGRFKCATICLTISSAACNIGRQ